MKELDRCVGGGGQLLHLRLAPVRGKRLPPAARNSCPAPSRQYYSIERALPPRKPAAATAGLVRRCGRPAGRQRAPT